MTEPKARHGEIISFSHCQACGRAVDPQDTDEGYTHCCNERVVYPGHDYANRPARCADDCYHE